MRDIAWESWRSVWARARRDYAVVWAAVDVELSRSKVVCEK